MYEISPKNILVPILYKTAIPIFINNKNGTKYESNANCKIIKHKITAITTYIITSESDRFFVSKDIDYLIYNILRDSCIYAVQKKYIYTISYRLKMLIFRNNFERTIHDVIDYIERGNNHE